MHRTTSLQYSSSIFLLLLLVLTATVSSSKKKQQEEQQQEEGPDINLTKVDIHNDLPPNSPRLFLVGAFQLSEDQIDPGKSFFFLAGGRSAEAIVILGDDQCAPFLAFDAKAELGRPAVFWSVRSDGVYHSFDRSNWQRKASWHPIKFCQ